MSSQRHYAFQPDYAVPPGEILAETLEARGISQAELASRCGLSEKHISQVIHIKASISPEMALRLERALGVRATLWMNLESMYRLHAARIEERSRVVDYIDWARRFPIRSLAERRWIRPSNDAEEQARMLLDFFGVASPSAWESQYGKLAVAYRRSAAFRSSPDAVAAWMRIGEIKAAEIDTDPFEKSKFREALDAIRMLTSSGPSIFEPQMKELCREAGVALVFVPELPKTHLSGATRWLAPGKALIMQSLRFRSDDHFWFTFFHEAAHTLLHGKRALFVDEVGMEASAYEEEADAFAADHLIPRVSYQSFLAQGTISRMRILDFASRLDIAPGIVVGRLQHDGVVPFSWFRDLKRTFVFADETHEPEV